MSVGIQRVFVATMASAGTLTGAIDLGRAFPKAYLVVHTLTSNTNIHIHAAHSATGTYFRVVSPLVNTATIGHNTFTIGSASTGRVHELPAGLQFIKIETTATCDSGETFRVLCQDI